MIDGDGVPVTVWFADKDKADAFRERIGDGGGYIRWDGFDDDAHATVWLDEEARA